MRRPLRLLAVLLLAAGCGADAGAPAPEPGAPGGSPPSAATPPVGAEGWVVSPTGAGDVRIGMRFGELAPLLEPGADTAALGDACGYLRIVGAPDGTRFMAEGRRLVRIEVHGGPTPTAEGARVGDTESRILSLYPGAERQPHKYTDGYYLVHRAAPPADTLHGYVFETDGERVTTYRAGIAPQLHYVEGCS